jgi:hypothetical protein
MTSDQTRHTAAVVPGAVIEGGPTAWSVSWLPGRLLLRNQAITAMTIAEVAATREFEPGAADPIWLHIDGWAAELGITGPHAVAEASRTPEDHAAMPRVQVILPEPDFSHGINELADSVNFSVGAWRDFGYETPPTPECKPIPPLGERSAEAIKAAHAAIETIDELTRQLCALRSQLVGELRQDEDVRAGRVDAILARLRQERQS